MITRTGGIRWLRSLATTRRRPHDDAVVWDGILLDITDLKETEAALRKREADYRLLAEYSRDIISRHTAGGLCLYASPAIESLLGYKSEEVTGIYPFQIVHPEDAPHLMAAHRRIFEENVPVGCTCRFRHRDGHYVWFESHGALVRHPDETHSVQIICVSRDVTTRRNAEEALRRREEFLQQITDTVPAFIAYVDRDLSFRFNNRRAGEWFGEGWADLAGRRIDDIVAPEHLAGLMPYLRAAQAGQEVGFVTEARPVGSSHRHLRVHYIPHRDPDGTVAGFFVLAHDISHFKQVEQELREARDAAEQANLGKSRFLAAASHDLRQPLNAMSLLVGLLRGRVADGHGQEILSQIQGALDTMIEQFNALLDLSRFETGHVRVNRGPVALDKLLRRIEADFAPLARVRNLSFRLRAAPVVLDTDATILEQILRNLIANAIRYTKTGGVLVGCRRRNGAIRIDVIDTGPGIPAEQADNIFEEFYQLANKARRREHGYGLGLAIVRRAADLLNHSIEVVSRPGYGSRFSVTVPCAAAEPTGSADAAASDESGAVRRGLTVLLIEDDPLVRLATRMALEEFGCTVLEAGTLDDALALVTSSAAPPHLIISDYRLPGGRDGIQAIVEIRARLEAEIAACVVTGDLDRSIAARAQAAGARILHKPIRAEDLEVLIGSIAP